MRLHLFLAALLGASLLYFMTVLSPLAVSSESPSHFPNCRLGVAVVWAPPGDPNLVELNLGWYGNFYHHTDPAPEGMQFVPTIRLGQTKIDPPTAPAGSDCRKYFRDCYASPPTYTLASPAPWSALSASVAANPGRTWLVGNEPDRRSWWNGASWDGQDEITPEVYARAFCEVSRAIRLADPTARVAIGGVVQATPLRMKYLDRVWAAYPAACGGRSLGDDVDVWNMHSYVLQEKSAKCVGVGNAWGAEIPAGLGDCQGELHTPQDNANVSYVQQQIVRFRTWMRDKGQRNKPLILTESGANYGTYYITVNQVKALMTSVFDYALNQKDANLGNPFDENRLVQQLLWWSLDFNEQPDPDQTSDYACYPNCTFMVDSLLGTTTQQAYRAHWAAYVSDAAHPEASIPRVNPAAGDTQTSPTFYAHPTGPVTFTLKAYIYNSGNTSPDPGAVQATFYQGTHGQPGAIPIGSPQVVDNMCGCGNRILVQQTWLIPGTPPASAAYPWHVSVTMEGQEKAFGSGTAVIGSSSVFLPIVLRDGS